MNNVLKVLVGARKLDKFVEWGQLMESCGTLHVSKMMLDTFEVNGVVTVRRGDVVTVILTSEGYRFAVNYLEKKGMVTQ